MIELKTEHWYLMKENFSSFSKRSYIKIYIPSQQLPLKEDYEINFIENGVRTIVPRFIKKSEFLKWVDRIVTEEEVINFIKDEFRI